ncbi:SAF domain-containing protein [Angustibacter aerolatus]
MSSTQILEPPLAPARAATRLRAPSWRDPRLSIGLLLVFGSVLLGAWTLSRADDRTPSWVAAAALAPGQVVGPHDVTTASVDLGDRADAYLDRSTVVVGQVVVRAVQPGELVPRAALGDRAQVRLRPVSVPLGDAEAGTVVAGSLVDVWVSDPPAATATSGTARVRPPRLLAEAVEVAGVTSQRGRLGGSTGSTVQVLLTPELVPQALAALADEARVSLLPVPGGRSQAGS